MEDMNKALAIMMVTAEFMRIHKEQGEDAAIAWAERQERILNGEEDKADLKVVE